jgi:hypothetical protein
MYLRGARGGATSRNVAGSIPDGAIGIFFLTYSFGPGIDQTLPEMITRNISWGGKDCRCVGMTNLPASRAGDLKASNYRNSQGLSRTAVGFLGSFLYVFT